MGAGRGDMQSTGQEKRHCASRWAEKGLLHDISQSLHCFRNARAIELYLRGGMAAKATAEHGDCMMHMMISSPLETKSWCTGRSGGPTTQCKLLPGSARLATSTSAIPPNHRELTLSLTVYRTCVPPVVACGCPFLLLAASLSENGVLLMGWCGRSCCRRSLPGFRRTASLSEPS